MGLAIVCSFYIRLLCQVSKTVNGPMMEILAKAIDYKDAECVEMFRLGGPLFGFLPYSGNGDQIEYAMEGSLKELMKNRGERNKSLLAGLKEAANSEVLLNKACEDAQMGRMTRPRPINEFDLEKVVLSPRFAVEQGTIVALLSPIVVLDISMYSYVRPR